MESQALPRVNAITELHSARWLSLRKVEYTDAKGATKFWESVERTTKLPGVVDCVEIIAIFKKKGEADKILLVKQFRPPVGKFCVEFPAGLVDKGETAEEAARRELKEETGYTPTTLSAGPEISYEPGLTSATCSLVYASIDGDDAANQSVVQTLEDDEAIECLLVPLDGILDKLHEAAAEGLAIDAKLWAFAFGACFRARGF